ncbi:unnamed protein product [Brassicogethes aeneus]|uniref:SH3 domain-containing protein n=1 Tax=Brassicogethes aeneus TaxID=1431903 RepID=A0A9P0BG32_BRAAE|nr:unnamed protein product [Brassicogethes aeneus]
MAYRNGYSENDRDMDRDDRTPEGGKPHIIEHLATFTVTPETGIMYPADGMRRLLQLEKSNGIWSQKMCLSLDNSWVLIMDFETGNVMERFPANSIQEPTAFTSQDPMDMYNNILVFIVGNAQQSHPPEMHIFQCQSISAQDLVEDLKQLRLGKAVSRSRKTSIPPPSHKPPQNIINPQRDHHARDYSHHHGSDSEVTANNDDSSSTTSEKYERDVTVLNHCFDDIEKFIARLQHAAAAARELERRRKSRKSKKRDMGDGMLTMRTKPPPEKEFIDIFQKFKLSFNLLAKLKAHIHDPNAPELVHFLFTPLALIVEASHDTYFDQHLPQNVFSPLLTREAVNLLMNCVTSKETELWHSLGNAWLMSRDQYKGNVPPYNPVFMDGWSPDIIDEPESSMDKYRDPHDAHYSDYNDYPSSQDILYDTRSNDNHHHPPDKERDLPPNIGDSTKSDISVDSIENRGDDRGFPVNRNQETFFEELQRRDANVVQVTYPRTANNEKELTVVRGEFLEILDNSRKWWKARNSRGQVAHVPHTIVAPYNPSSNNIFSNPIYIQHNRPREDSPMDRYTQGHSSGMSDHMPPTHQQMQSKNSSDWIKNERIDDYASRSPSPIPIPPPPPIMADSVPSPPPIMKAPQIRTTPLKDASPEANRKLQRSQSIASMHEQLYSVYSIIGEKEKKPHLDIKQTPDINIDHNSSKDDIQRWFNLKGFENETYEKFQNLSSKQLFSFSKEDLEKLCGAKGKRLYSQLLLQKNKSGYETIKVSELKHVLERRKKKVDDEGF